MIYVARAPPVLFLFVQRADVGCSWQQWQFPSSQISQALSVYEVYNVCLQALIQCSRWEDASSACAGLLPGVDQQYLRSELLWRQGQLPAAMKALQDALSSNPDSRKCGERLEFLQPITEELQQASTAMEEGSSSLRHSEHKGWWSFGCACSACPPS